MGRVFHALRTTRYTLHDFTILHAQIIQSDPPLLQPAEAIQYQAHGPGGGGGVSLLVWASRARCYVRHPRLDEHTHSAWRKVNRHYSLTVHILETEIRPCIKLQVLRVAILPSRSRPQKQKRVDMTPLPMVIWLITPCMTCVHPTSAVGESRKSK